MGKFFAAILRPFINFGLEARLEKFWRNSAKGKKVASKHYDQDTEMLKEMQTKHPEVIQILERKDENLDMNLKKLALKESVEKSPMADLRHS
ncbi:unnamed protein product, partial [Soboliphyme baturini]|uniref:Cytochrome b mRNA-processing protein 4 n=1 Tax=Soboliphyme baturini TaxID=241478 RepID=A0A183J6Z6_9BILA